MFFFCISNIWSPLLVAKLGAVLNKDKTIFLFMKKVIMMYQKKLGSHVSLHFCLFFLIFLIFPPFQQKNCALKIGQNSGSSDHIDRNNLYNQMNEWGESFILEDTKLAIKFRPFVCTCILLIR